MLCRTLYPELIADHPQPAVVDTLRRSIDPHDYNEF